LSFKEEAVKYFRRMSWRFGQSRRICFTSTKRETT